MRKDVVELVPGSARRVLDVGCASGAVGEMLKKHRSVEVWGIELNPVLAAEARKRLDRVIEADASEAVGDLDGSFDAVICADVLEHLARPEALLADLRPRTGRVIVSLPNVRFWTTFTELGLHGRWPQKDRGVHDRTHLRWFTDQDAREMFARAGFEVETMTRHYRLRDSPTARLNRLARYVAHGPLTPFLTYQMLYRLR